MINKLYIELALCKKTVNKDEDRYRLIDTVNDIDTVKPYSKTAENANSFIHKLQNTSNERKALLQIVEAKVLNMLFKNPFLFTERDKYSAIFSYLYFSFVDEEGKTIFSAPYITSSLLFNPDDLDSTYTLFTDGQRLGNRSGTYSKIHKRVDSELVKLEYGTSLKRNSASPEPDYYQLDKQIIINSLFNYFDAKSIVGNNYVSCYNDLGTCYQDMDIMTISTFELKQFIHVFRTPQTQSNTILV